MMIELNAFDQAIDEARSAAQLSDFDQHVLFDGKAFLVADDRSLDFGEPVGAIKMATCEGRRHGDY
jgi:hypothetical protein